MTGITNGFVRLGTKVLSLQYGADVSLVVFATHVCTSTDGLRVHQVFVGCFSGEDWS